MAKGDHEETHYVVFRSSIYGIRLSEFAQHHNSYSHLYPWKTGHCVGEILLSCTLTRARRNATNNKSYKRLKTIHIVGDLVDALLLMKLKLITQNQKG